MKIGWDFPYVSPELQNRFGLRGYVAAYILPEGFETSCPGVEYANQEDADYAVITIYDPFAAAFERIPNEARDVMTDSQFDSIMENGLMQAKADDSKSAKVVF